MYNKLLDKISPEIKSLASDLFEKGKPMSSSQMVDLVFLYFIFHFVLFSYFSIFRTARVRVRSDWSYCHISHNLMASHKTDHETWENGVEGSGIK